MLHRAHVGSFLPLDSTEIILGLFKPVQFLSLPPLVFSSSSVPTNPALPSVATALPWVQDPESQPWVSEAGQGAMSSEEAAEGAEPGTELVPHSWSSTHTVWLWVKELLFVFRFRQIQSCSVGKYCQFSV